MNFTPLPTQAAPDKARNAASKALEAAVARTGRKLDLIEGEQDGRPRFFVREWFPGTCTETSWMGLASTVSYLGGLQAEEVGP